MDKSPKVSVVTVVYNDASSLVKTMESVKSQTYNNIEFIVIDGGSTDGTLASIDGFSEIVTTLVSESDDGIYDAMNKGARLATGDYITFLNAGDIYYSKDAINNIMTLETVSNYDAIYGSNYYLKNNEMIFQKPRPLKLFYKGMPFNHQSVFVKADLVKNFPFKSDIYKIQCEYEFLLNLYLKGYKFFYSDVVVAVYEAGGYSDKNFLERTLERWLIIKRCGICDGVADRHYFNLVARACDFSEINATKNKKDSFIKKIVRTLWGR